jgi:hypothetical protein
MAFTPTLQNSAGTAVAETNFLTALGGKYFFKVEAYNSSTFKSDLYLTSLSYVDPQKFH